ncbi:MAG: hypothetical protein AAF846_05815 [Chloroflexota bacterium]
MILLLSLTIITFAMTVRALFVVVGGYKDPLLATFEQYGEEQIFSPILMLIAWSASFVYIVLYWYIDPAVVFGIGLLILIPLAGSFHFIVAFVRKYDHIMRMYPRWYYQLIQMTDREERRRIAYMWLFLPPSTRMIYNSNNTLFWQWVEQVLMTVAQ